MSTDLSKPKWTLSHKLWCYTRISGPEKSRNNTHKKKTIVFFYVCWYSQLAAYTSLAFGATRLMIKRQSLHDSQYKLFVAAFSKYGG